MKNGLNPASIWQLPELRETAERTGASRRATNQDFYGAPYPKPTGLLTTRRPSDTLGVEVWPKFDESGYYIGPLPPPTSPPMPMGKANTEKTAAYPPAMCEDLATYILMDLDRRRLSLGRAQVPSGRDGSNFGSDQGDGDDHGVMMIKAATIKMTTLVKMTSVVVLVVAL